MPASSAPEEHLASCFEAKMALVAVCRRCKHRRLIYPRSLIERFDENTPALDIRPLLRCSACRYRSANLHETGR